MSGNRFGAVYPYFICQGLHLPRQRREAHRLHPRQAVPISVVEDLVEAEYRAVQLTPEARRDIEAILREELQTTHAAIEAERRDLTIQQERLTKERTRLLQAHSVGAIPLDLLKEEQTRIARQLATVEERLEATKVEFSALEQHIQAALGYASNCYLGYVAAGHHVRRLYNQAFFERIYVDDDAVRVELREPFRTLLTGNQVEPTRSAVTHQDDSTQTSTMGVGSVVRHVIPSQDNKKPTTVSKV
ncbi:hypothetical protein RE943_30490 [Prescottella equi]|nr:hypothetical protein RE943_30490 [Prescottella equi]